MTEQGSAAEIRAAIREVRREGYKAAALHAVVDAVLATVVTNLVLSTVVVPWVPAAVALPEPLVAALEVVVGGDLVAVTVDGSALLATTVGAAVLTVEVGVSLRRPAVERFERANPAVAEALRTARDAVEAGDERRMARVLYGSVLERLRGTSGVNLVDVRRMAVSILLVLALGLATVQLSVAGVEFAPDLSRQPGGDAAGEGTSAPDGRADTAAGAGGYEGLQSTADVLGEPENVTAGTLNRSVELETSGGAGEDRERSYDASGFAGDDADVEAQRAGYTASEELDDADLVREYNLRIRQDDGEDEDE